ncbi:hypothetical protein EC12741_3599 [Escherichia coli 1.2741]|nr:hypothetical protein ERJG_02933 [Escherichia coli M863]EGE62105.1 hypothetical protein ECSTEC7V_4788 [Escherichia coli STEC_7v]EIG80770.1 hypothetical protein EC12741_3599 [Escherichia coli 1.2741]
MGSFLSINAIRREIVQHGFMCDFLFIVETELFIIAFHTLTSNKIISSIRESVTL